MKSKLILCLALGLIFLLGVELCEAKRAKTAGKEKAQANDELRQLIQTDFPRWDDNHDGLLSPDEINALIENPQATGDEAAALVVIRKSFSQDGDENESGGLTQAQLSGLANEKSVQREFSRNKRLIGTVNRSLFIAGDPNLFTFHQGRVGDCYLLAVIGAFVNRNPQSVRAMIKPLSNNMLEVDFASGQKISVSNATDAELLQGAKIGSDHGVWLSILEKAYASIRETKRKNENSKPGAPDDAVPKDFLGGGRPAPAIEQFTGHKAASVPLADSAKNDLQGTTQKVHGLLIQLSSERQLMAVGTVGKDKMELPPKIPHGHVFAVLGYDSIRHMVRVFNPWGNEVTPAGTPGLANGYVTQNGMFDVPLQEFVQIFKALTYETKEPLDN
jgi:hypothetical protein